MSRLDAATRPWRMAALVIALVAFIPVARALFSGDTIGAFDWIRTAAPWNAAPPARPFDILQADSVLQFYGWRDLVFKAWAGGHLPLWNPYELGGSPLLANSQSAGFYPPHILAGVLRLPTGLAIALLAWIHLAWAGLGVWWLGRRLGASSSGAMVGGICFALSPFLVAWTALPSVITTVAWIPWCLGATLWACEGGARRAAVALAACAAMMLLGGHLQFAAYGVMACLLTAAIGCVRLRHPLGAIWVVTGLGIGFLLGAPQVLPALKLGAVSARSTPPTAEGYGAMQRSALRPYELLRLATPGVQGSPEVAAVGPVQAYLPLLRGQPNGNYAEGAFALGPLVLLLVLLAGWRRRLLEVAVVGAVFLALGFGAPLNWLLYYLVPGWAATGSPGRAVVLFVIAACAIASLGADRLIEGSAGKPAIGRSVAVLLGFVGVACAWSWVLAKQATAELPPGALAAFTGQIGPAVLGAIAAALGAAAPIVVPWISARVGLCFAALAAALSYGALTIVPIGSPAGMWTLPRTDVRVAVVGGKWGMLGPRGAFIPPNTATFLGLREVTGYDSLIGRAKALRLRETLGARAPLVNGNMLLLPVAPDPGALAKAGVGEVWLRNDAPPLGPPFTLIEKESVARYAVPGSRGSVRIEWGAARVVDEQADEMRIEYEGGGKLSVATDAVWSAWYRGEELRVEALDGWISFDVPPGKGEVNLSCEPPGLAVGLWLGLAGVMTAATLLLSLKWSHSP